MLSVVINMKIMKWYTMYIFFVDLGVVVCVDTEWVIWDFDTKIREKSCLDLGLENYTGLGLGLDKKVLVLVLVLTTRSYLHHWLYVMMLWSMSFNVVFACTDYDLKLPVLTVDSRPQRARPRLVQTAIILKLKPALHWVRRPRRPIRKLTRTSVPCSMENR